MGSDRADEDRSCDFIRRAKRNTGRQTMMNTNLGAGMFDPKYPTGEPVEK